jgi:hypothetical protein
LEPLQSNPHLEESFCKSLLCRIRFRKVSCFIYSFFDKCC